MFVSRRSDADSMQAVAVHPVRAFVHEQEAEVPTAGRARASQIFTCGPDESVRVWDLEARRMVEATLMEEIRMEDVPAPITPTCLSVSPNGLVVAVGFQGGQWGLFLRLAQRDDAGPRLPPPPRAWRATAPRIVSGSSSTSRTRGSGGRCRRACGRWSERWKRCEATASQRCTPRA